MIILNHLKYMPPTFKTLEMLEEEEEENDGMDVTLNSFTCLLFLEHMPGVRYCVKKWGYLKEEEDIAATRRI